MVRNHGAVLQDLLFTAANFSPELERSRYTEIEAVVHGANELKNLHERRLTGWREGVCEGNLAWPEGGRKTV
jgi:hypothetical protein